MFTYLTFIVNSLYNNKDPCHTDKSLLFCIIIKTHERIFSGGSASAGSEAKVSRGGISHEYSSPFPVHTCPFAAMLRIEKSGYLAELQAKAATNPDFQDDINNLQEEFLNCKIIF